MDITIDNDDIAIDDSFDIIINDIVEIKITPMDQQ